MPSRSTHNNHFQQQPNDPTKIHERKKINTTLSRKDCDKGLSTINLKQINGGLNISFFSKGENIKSSNLLFINLPGSLIK